MKARKLMLILAVCFAAVALASASDANMGTWKLNEAKSMIPAGAGKNTTVSYEAAGDSIKVTVDGVDGKGSPTHNEWTGKFDGKDYPLTGDAVSDTRSYKKVNALTTDLTNKKDGKVTLTGKIVISADGKSRTVTISGTDPAGKKIKYSAVYDKQ
jgi:polyisoprenoid-binding protein YceI